MKRNFIAVGTALAGLFGCDLSRPPQMAIPADAASAQAASPAPVASTPTTAASRKPSPKESAKPRYHGRTAEQWGQVLRDGHLDQAYKASAALRLMGMDGRAQLFQGLESSNPESRRMALEALSVSDIRSFGDRGHQALVRLAGDRADMRIRQRAMNYLAQWKSATPSHEGGHLGK